jgi:TonB family protein
MRVLLWMIALLAGSAFVQTPARGTWPREMPGVFVDLSYPPEALVARVIGRVVVRVTTDASGRVVEAESLSGADQLVSAVIANVKQWTLSPGADRGRRVSI